MYTKSLDTLYTQRVLTYGVWAFDHIARSPRGQEALLFYDAGCSAMARPGTSHRARVRSSVRGTMNECVGIAERLDVCAISRGNHYNSRFGVNCADDGLMEVLNGTGWGWWDNRRLSKDAWRTQSSDGFHFDRWNDHAVAQHIAHREVELAQGREAPGMLEMQFAQSLLHRLFRDELQRILDDRSAQPLRR
jgi:hypothetical protein